MLTSCVEFRVSGNVAFRDSHIFSERYKIEMKKKFYSQHDFDRDCMTIASHIDSTKQTYDVVVALGRGGIPAGTRIAHLLKLPLEIVPYSLKDDTRHARAREMAARLKNQRILVVDDISDSGHTLEEISFHLDGEVFHTATLVYKPQSKHKPKYFSMVHLGDEWLEFFWEEQLISM